MDREQLASRFPTLWHLCASDDPQVAWTRLQHEGLLSVEALADSNGVDGQERHDLLKGHRSRPIQLAPGVAVRDAKPMPEGMLRHVVHGETPEDWRARLNGLVFFHPGGQSASPEAAPRRYKILWERYSSRPRLVIVLDTARVASRPQGADHAFAHEHRSGADGISRAWAQHHSLTRRLAGKNHDRRGRCCLPPRRPSPPDREGEHLESPGIRNDSVQKSDLARQLNALRTGA